LAVAGGNDAISCGWMDNWTRCAN